MLKTENGDKKSEACTKVDFNHVLILLLQTCFNFVKTGTNVVKQQ